jgi:hypothetical protein
MLTDALGYRCDSIAINLPDIGAGIFLKTEYLLYLLEGKTACGQRHWCLHLVEHSNGLPLMVSWHHFENGTTPSLHSINKIISQRDSSCGVT